MNVACVALDLDETTLDRHSQLSPANRAALAALIDQGIEVILASGRAYHTFPKELLTFPGIRYAIASNGTSIVDLTTGTYLCQRLLSPQAVEAILAATADFPLHYETFVDGHAYADQAYVAAPERYGASPRAAAYVRATRTPVADIRSFIRQHQSTLEAIDLIVWDPVVKREAWTAVEQTQVPVYITSSTPRLVEISHPDGGKGPALRELLQRLHMDPAQTVAFGNGDNDAAMLSLCGCGIAVENATDACKAAATFVTRHHDEDGVAYALKNYLHLFHS